MLRSPCRRCRAGRAEPGEHRLDVADLLRAVDADQPTRLAVAACVVGEHCVPVAREESALSDRVHVLARAAETVKEHEGGPAGRRGCAVR